MTGGYARVFGLPGHPRTISQFLPRFSVVVHAPKEPSQAMPANNRTSSDFVETLAIHSALRFALAKRAFTEPEIKSAAERLVRELEGEDSVYGRQMRMCKLMKRGVTVEELGEKLNASRRTIFRYFNYLEQAGINIRLEDGKYSVDGDSPW